MQQQNGTRRRLTPDERTEEILAVALGLAKLHGYKNISRALVAKAANCSESLISERFGDMPRFQNSILRAAVHREVAEIVLQGLIIKDPIAVAAPHDLKERAKALLSVK